MRPNGEGVFPHSERVKPLSKLLLDWHVYKTLITPVAPDTKVLTRTDCGFFRQGIRSRCFGIEQEVIVQSNLRVYRQTIGETKRMIECN